MRWGTFGLLVIGAGCFTEPSATPAPGDEGAAETTGASAGETSRATDGPLDDGGDETGSVTTGETDTDTDTGSGGSGPPLDPACPREQVFEFDPITTATGVDNLPVPVFLGPDNLDYAATQPDGSDLHVRHADAHTELDFEIDTWRRGGDTVLWVLVPRIDADHDRIVLCYGGEPLMNPREPEAVWRDGYVGVWHMSEDVAAPRGPHLLRDATEHHHDGELHDAPDTADPVQFPSALGRALRFEHLGGSIAIPSGDDLDLGAALTLEVYLEVEQPTDEYRTILRHGAAWAVLVTDIAGRFPGVEVDLTPGASAQVNATQLTTSAPLYISATFDSGVAELRVCADGRACNTMVFPADTMIGPASAPVIIGGADAVVDEVRISTKPRPEAWHAAMARGLAGTLLFVDA